MATSVYNPGASILETYINAQKEKFRQEQEAATNEVNRQNVASETDFRNKQAQGIAQQLADEHKKNLATIDASIAQMQAHKAALAAAHQQAHVELQKAIREGNAPAPQTGITQVGTDPNGTPVNGMVGVTSSPGDPNNPLHNAPYVTPEGETYAPGSLLTPQQSVAQQAPQTAADITKAGLTKGAEESATVEANKPLYAQQQLLEQRKLDNALKIADVTSLRNETVAQINSQARVLAAQINGRSRITAAGIKNTVTPEEITDRAQQLKYGEGPAMGHSQVDMAAMSALKQAGSNVINPKTLDNIKGLKPLENFTADMTDFANKYLPTSKIGGVLNAAKLNLVPNAEETNEYNQLLLQATNIAKGVEGATGRILQSQIQTAKTIIANKTVTRKEMVDNANKIQSLVTAAVEGQLGNLKPEDRVDFLAHHGFDTLAAHVAAKNKLASPGQPAGSINYLNHPDYVVVKP